VPHGSLCSHMSVKIKPTTSTGPLAAARIHHHTVHLHDKKPPDTIHAHPLSALPPKPYLAQSAGSRIRDLKFQHHPPLASGVARTDRTPRTHRSAKSSLSSPHHNHKAVTQVTTQQVRKDLPHMGAVQPQHSAEGKFLCAIYELQKPVLERAGRLSLLPMRRQFSEWMRGIELLSPQTGRANGLRRVLRT
jgi:hypothetical protein